MAVVGIGGIISAFPGPLGRFTGDPCLPVGYPYPWINCTSQDNIASPRVLSMWVPLMTITSWIRSLVTSVTSTGIDRLYHIWSQILVQLKPSGQHSACHHQSRSACANVSKRSRSINVIILIVLIICKWARFNILSIAQSYISRSQQLITFGICNQMCSSFDGNALEGSLPTDLSSLVNLRFL
jgi:hypothetical protein